MCNQINYINKGKIREFSVLRMTKLTTENGLRSIFIQVAEIVNFKESTSSSFVC